MSDILFEDDGNDSDCSFFSNSEMDPQSVNVNFSNGSPLNDGDFTIVHFNINSITAEGRLEQLTDLCSILKVDCLVGGIATLDFYYARKIETIIYLKGTPVSLLMQFPKVVHLNL